MAVYTIIYGLKFSNSYDFQDYKCNITNVIYPKELPNSLYGYQNFVNCDCGHKCISDLGICNKIFISNDNNDNILLNEKFDSNDNKCTFREKKCKHGENYINRLSKISNNMIDMQYYENFINNTIHCYRFKNIYFIDNYNYLKEFIIFLILFIVFIIIILITINFINKSTNLNKKYFK